MKSLTNILLVLWSLTMAGLLFTPGSPGITRHFFDGEDKVAHFVLFFGWTFLMTLRGLYNQTNNIRLIIRVVVAAIIIAISTEVIQGIIPYRSQDFFDLLADLVGTAFGIFVAFLLKKHVIPF